MRSPLGTLVPLAVSLALAVAAGTLGVGCSRRAGPGGGPAGATSTPSAGASASKAPGNELTQTGAALYERYCALCHGKDATGYAADNAPSLVTRTFLESADDAFIASAIRVGRPNTAMGAYGQNRGGPLDNTAINSIVSFIRARGPKSFVTNTAGAAQGNGANGAALYAKHCAECHGTETKRETALSLFNPELLATATPAFLRYAIVNGRAPTPMPAFGDKLSKSDIEDLVTFLMSKMPSAPPSAAPIATVPENLPVVINPKGRAPNFKLREDRFVAADDVKQALAEKRRIVIIDARSPADWVGYHIPGAISVPYYNPKFVEKIPNDGTWVVAYCACPHHASGAIVDALRAKNYKHTAVLDEGILYWKSKGYPLDGEVKQ